MSKRTSASNGGSSSGVASSKRQRKETAFYRPGEGGGSLRRPASASASSASSGDKAKPKALTKINKTTTTVKAPNDQLSQVAKDVWQSVILPFLDFESFMQLPHISKTIARYHAHRVLIKKLSNLLAYGMPVPRAFDESFARKLFGTPAFLDDCQPLQNLVEDAQLHPELTKAWIHRLCIQHRNWRLLSEAAESFNFVPGELTFIPFGVRCVFCRCQLPSWPLRRIRLGQCNYTNLSTDPDHSTDIFPDQLLKDGEARSVEALMYDHELSVLVCGYCNPHTGSKFMEIDSGLFKMFGFEPGHIAGKWASVRNKLPTLADKFYLDDLRMLADSAAVDSDSKHEQKMQAEFPSDPNKFSPRETPMHEVIFAPETFAGTPSGILGHLHSRLVPDSANVVSVTSLSEEHRELARDIAALSGKQRDKYYVKAFITYRLVRRDDIETSDAKDRKDAKDSKKSPSSASNGSASGVAAASVPHRINGGPAAAAAAAALPPVPAAAPEGLDLTGDSDNDGEEFGVEPDIELELEMPDDGGDHDSDSDYNDEEGDVLPA